MKYILALLSFYLQHTTVSVWCVDGAPTAATNIYELRNCTQEDLRQLSEQSTANELILNECNIPELENAIFLRYNALTTLEITDSKLTTLQDYALNGLRQLQSLSLERNNITHVKSWSNEPMLALISLDLRRNAIRDLTLNSFHRYPSLQRLNLAHNLLDDIDDGIFRWMPQLRYLNLGRNLLKTIDARNFHGMHRLTHLSLHYNDLNAIEASSFQTNTHLRLLRLEGNELDDLEFMTLMNLVRLVHLNLSHNAIDSLDSLTFSKDYELRNLDLSYNRLGKVLVDTFAGLESLEALNISHNAIGSIDSCSFQELISLERLDLSSNQLRQLPPDLFNGSTQLQHINLSTNAIHQVDTLLFVGLTHLRVLDLSGNALQTDSFLEYFAHDLDRTQLQLNLSRNHFTELNITALVDLQSVELIGNTWSCSWLIPQMLRTTSSIHFGQRFSIVNTWSSALLEVSGIDCFDGENKRSIVVLDPNRHQEQHIVECVSSTTASTESLAPPLIWPQIRLDKFDSRSVVIWLLIIIVVIFSTLRIAQRFTNRKRQKRLLQEMNDHSCPEQECMEELDNLRNSDRDSISELTKYSHRSGIVPKL